MHIFANPVTYGMYHYGIKYVYGIKYAYGTEQCDQKL